MARAVAPEYLWLDQSGNAFGAPGHQPRWTSSEKDAVGTAYAASSRAWFTVSHGILNEIYFPTIDRAQTRDMEFLITDGETFFHEEKRDLEHEFAYIDSDALGVRIVNRDREGRYSLTKEIINDPHYPVVLIHTRLEAKPDILPRLKLYALMSPHVDGGGAGNNARVVEVAGKRVLLAWKDGSSLAMAADCGFSRASCGYVGSSDGWQDLKDNFTMDWQFGSALNGNVAVLGEIPPGTREFTVALGFGVGHHAALSATMGALATPFKKHLSRFIEQWHRSASPYELAAHSQDGGRLLQISHNIVLAHEDKIYGRRFHRFGVDSVGLCQERRRPRRVSPGLDPRHGAERDCPAGLRPRGHRPARPGLSRLHAEAGRRLFPKFLGERHSVLDRHATG